MLQEQIRVVKYESLFINIHTSSSGSFAGGLVSQGSGLGSCRYVKQDTRAKYCDVGDPKSSSSINRLATLAASKNMRVINLLEIWSWPCFVET